MNASLIPSIKAAALPLPSAADLRRFYMDGGAAVCGACHVKPTGLVDVRGIAAVTVLSAPTWSHPELRFLVRPEVASRLAVAAKGLPEDLRLGFWEGYRPLSVQRALWNSGLAYLRSQQPEAPDSLLEGTLADYVARPGAGTPPHSTGSAVDIAAIDAFGRILSPDDAWGKIGHEALAKQLVAAGLTGYALEWWHWSYGDEEWARENDCAPLPFPTISEYDGPGGGI